MKLSEPQAKALRQIATPQIFGLRASTLQSLERLRLIKPSPVAQHPYILTDFGREIFLDILRTSAMTPTLPNRKET